MTAAAGTHRMRQLEGNAAWRSLGDSPGYLPRKSAKAPLRDGVEDPVLVLRRAVRFMRKSATGRRGLPTAVVQRMWLDYLHLGSLAKVAKLYDRTRQSIYEIFKKRGLPLNARNFHARLLWNGEPWTPGKDGYYRPTTGDRNRRLHVCMWQNLHGAVPVGHQVGFLNGDNTDLQPGNLFCAPVREVTLHHYRRRFPGRADLNPAQRKAFWKTYQREAARIRRAEADRERDLGLRR